MKQPKFTDKRYPHGYTSAANTNIQVTFRRIRREMAEAAEKRRTDKVRQIK